MIRNEFMSGRNSLRMGATEFIEAEASRTVAALGARAAIRGRFQKALVDLTDQIRDAGSRGAVYDGDVRLHRSSRRSPPACLSAGSASTPT